MPKHDNRENNVRSISNNTDWSKLSMVPPDSSSSIATSSLALATSFVYKSSNALSSHTRIGGIVASPYNFYFWSLRSCGGGGCCVCVVGDVEVFMIREKEKWRGERVQCS